MFIKKFIYLKLSITLVSAVSCVKEDVNPDKKEVSVEDVILNARSYSCYSTYDTINFIAAGLDSFFIRADGYGLDYCSCDSQALENIKLGIDTSNNHINPVYSEQDWLNYMDGIIGKYEEDISRSLCDESTLALVIDSAEWAIDEMLTQSIIDTTGWEILHEFLDSMTLTPASINYCSFYSDNAAKDFSEQQEIILEISVSLSQATAGSQGLIDISEGEDVQAIVWHVAAGLFGAWVDVMANTLDGDYPEGDPGAGKRLLKDAGRSFVKDAFKAI